MIIFLSAKYLSMDRREHNLILNVEELTWWFDDSQSLLFDKFNFSLYKWDFTILMWKSWAWKTVFSKFLIWKIPAPKKCIFYKMSDISTFSKSDIQMYRRKLWLVFQDYNLLYSMSVKDNIIYPLQIYGMWEETIELKYQKVKEDLWLEWLENRRVIKLSGWEKQLVGIARAVIHDPEMIIADEPTWNLDWENTQRVADILIDLNKKWKTILLITHDIHLLNYISKQLEVSLFKI